MPARLAAVGAVALALAADARGLLRLPLPQAARQIPREVFAAHPLRAAVRFGYPLGSGVRTYLVSRLPYLPAAAIVLLAPPLPAALAVGAGFGLARGLLPVGYLVRRPA